MFGEEIGFRVIGGIVEAEDDAGECFAFGEHPQVAERGPDFGFQNGARCGENAGNFQRLVRPGDQDAADLEIAFREAEFPPCEAADHELCPRRGNVPSSNLTSGWTRSACGVTPRSMRLAAAAVRQAEVVHVVDLAGNGAHAEGFGDAGHARFGDAGGALRDLAALDAFLGSRADEDDVVFRSRGGQARASCRC